MAFMPQIMDGLASESCFESYLLSTIQQLTCFPGAFVIHRLLERGLGRKLSVIIFTVASGATMLCIPIFSNIQWVTVLSSLCICFNYMGWSGLYTIISDTYPTEIRSIGSGWVAFNLKTASILSPYITGMMLQTLGVTSAILLFAAMLLLAGATGCVMKETRGSKTL
mmetsp:Transcript_26156/g.46531  ORF Transcript_26156/g.46531 Transcript_26156/m.46531 type:complete len:167 (+) Transcript_26156:877-1377(+)